MIWIHDETSIIIPFPPPRLEAFGLLRRGLQRPEPLLRLVVRLQAQRQQRRAGHLHAPKIRKARKGGTPGEKRWENDGKSMENLERPWKTMKIWEYLGKTVEHVSFSQKKHERFESLGMRKTLEHMDVWA